MTTHKSSLIALKKLTLETEAGPEFPPSGTGWGSGLLEVGPIRWNGSLFSRLPKSGPIPSWTLLSEEEESEWSEEQPKDPATERRFFRLVSSWRSHLESASDWSCCCFSLASSSLCSNSTGCCRLLPTA